MEDTSERGSWFSAQTGWCWKKHFVYVSLAFLQPLGPSQEVVGALGLSHFGRFQSIPVWVNCDLLRTTGHVTIQISVGLLQGSGIREQKNLGVIIS